MRWRSSFDSDRVLHSIRFVAWLSFIILIALGSANETAVATAAEIGTKPVSTVNFQLISKGYRSGVREPRQAVVRSQAEWLELWRTHSNELYSTPPTVLFDQQVVVAIFLGEKPTGGYDITITRTERSGDELLIFYQEKVPTPGSMLVQAFTQPFHMVRIPSKEIGAKVTFRRMS
jgi:hypothetical protein